jgi:hypothetical protein
MGRLIEVRHVQECPRFLRLRSGDLLAFSATGGRIRSGEGVLEMLGAFLPAVIAPDREVLSPAGAPNTVMFLARRAGRSTMDVVTGDPWRAARTTTFDVLVED